MKTLNDKLIELSEELHMYSITVAGTALEANEGDEELSLRLSQVVEHLQDAELILDSLIEHSTTFLLLKANGEISRVEIPYEEFHDRVHELVGCEYFELVGFKDGFYFVVDELGKCYDEPKPVNKKASLFYTGFIHGDFIVGDVLIGKHGYVEGEPDIVGLSEDELKHFEKILSVIK